ncbi:hypothetical protein PG996_009913 [Apiospora saccharicola]|uniref:2EXR domain-containing protein n=1 Tax=Apiospora saccharicola TaxID=335842 RepID=A0ABR1UM34_9PEZI
MEAYINPKTDLGALKKLPLEIRWAIYDLAMPPRILRAYRDREHEHLLLEALAAHNVALICQETRHYFGQKYTQISYDPVWYPNNILEILNPSPRPAMKPQVTWYCPSIDALYIDHVELLPLLRMRQAVVTAVEGEDGSQSQGESVAKWEDNSSLGSSLTFQLLEALSSVTKITETLLITVKDEYFLKFKNDTFAWTRVAAKYTQSHCIKGMGNSGSRLKLVPLSSSRFLFQDGQFKPRVSDSYIIKTWNTVFSDFSAKGFREDSFVSSQWHKALIERMIAVARYYWQNAYTTE